MSTIVLMTEDELGRLVRDAVRDGVRSALSDLGRPVNAMNERDAAAYLGLSPQTLRCWRSERQGPAFHKAGRSVIYRQKDLDDWLAKGRQLTSDSGRAVGYEKHC